MIDAAVSSLVCAGITSNNIFRLDVTTKAVSSQTPMPGTGAEVFALLSIASIDGYLVGKQQGSVPILARADFSEIKNPTWSSECSFFLVDTIDDKFAVAFTSTTPSDSLRHYDRETWLTDGNTIHADIDLAAVGNANNILNFGPYQYVVTIPSEKSSLSQCS